LSSGDAVPASFEELLARLEQTIVQLADGTAPLDELVAAHQRAGRLLAEAESRLEAVKARTEQLTRALTQ
jgi:exodeoxyribonuclease VII small subunit